MLPLGKRICPSPATVRKLLAAIFQEHDRLTQPEPALEQARLMDDVLARQHRAEGQG